MARNESGYKIYGTHYSKPWDHSKIIQMSQTDPSKKYSMAVFAKASILNIWMPSKLTAEKLS